MLFTWHIVVDHQLNYRVIIRANMKTHFKGFLLVEETDKNVDGYERESYLVRSSRDIFYRKQDSARSVLK